MGRAPCNIQPVPGDPRRLPMFPLQTVLFPHASLPLHVFELRYQALVADCLSGDRELGIVLITRGSEVGGGDRRATVGTLARIELASPLPGGRWSLLVSGVVRIRVVRWLPEEPYPQAEVVEVPVPPDGDGGDGTGPALGGGVASATAAVRKARALLSETGRAPALGADLVLDPDPEVAAWQVCALSPVTPFDAQRLLEVEGHRDRLSAVVALSTALAGDLTRLLADGG
jgi:Lon protease-like protein